MWCNRNETPKQTVKCTCCHKDIAACCAQNMHRCYGETICLCLMCKRLWDHYRETLYESWREETLNMFLKKSWDEILGAKIIKSPESGITITTRQHITCDKCNDICKIKDMDYIFSSQKSPYYRVCQKCSSLFQEYIRSIPTIENVRTNPYLSAVRYMFKEE